jgi:hypothetical protein
MTFIPDSPLFLEKEIEELKIIVNEQSLKIKSLENHVSSIRKIVYDLQSRLLVAR